MQKSRLNLFFIIVIIILSLVSLNFLFEKQSLKYELLSERSTPDVEQINYLSINSKNIVSGGVVGFVKFIDSNNQPKDLRQYVKIDALDEFDTNGNQLFILQDIIKMKLLSPRYMDSVYLRTINTVGDRITLSDSYNNLYFIKKNSKEVGMFDSTGDKTSLISSDLEYTKFMSKFLR